MRNAIIVLFLILFSFNLYSQEIYDVVRKDNGWTEIKLDNNQRKSGWTGNGEFEWDFSNSIIVIRKENGWTEVYDSNLSKISSGWTGDKDFSKFKVVKSNIVLRKNDGFTIRYNQKLTKVFSGY